MDFIIGYLYLAGGILTIITNLVMSIIKGKTFIWKGSGFILVPLYTMLAWPLYWFYVLRILTSKNKYK